jgi:three-Cys-motif partner protein
MVGKKNLATTFDTASPHTIRKFELIEAYVKAWAPKLLNYQECDGVFFIDCMSNSGIYQDGEGKEVFGTPIRVANYISDLMRHYPGKQAWLCFNDLSVGKIEVLKSYLPANTSNFNISTRCCDGNDLLKEMAGNFEKFPKTNYLLVYDPFEASIDWAALMPFVNHWGDVIINHMISDSIRGASQAKRDQAISKYEQTYLAGIEELATFGSDRDAYETRIQEIVADLRSSSGKRYYIASFPFFNTRNALVYNLIYGSSYIEGFKLFKKTAWQTFGGKSSSKDTHGTENQLMLDMTGGGIITTKTDEYCYYPQDIVKYLHEKFKRQPNVPLDEVWGTLDEHPVFPSEGYKPQIKSMLKSTYDDIISKSSITFTDRRW